MSAVRIPEGYARGRGLRRRREARRLSTVGRTEDGRTIRLAPAAAAAWELMRTRAELEGIVLIAVSGFRSVARQSAIIRAKLRAGETIDSVLRVVAAPGYSEHHSGKAIDISTAGMPELTEAFERTPAYRWLASRAGSFGFRMSFPRGNRHGFSFEPWHWLFVGTRGKA